MSELHVQCTPIRRVCRTTYAPQESASRGPDPVLHLPQSSSVPAHAHARLGSSPSAAHMRAPHRNFGMATLIQHHATIVSTAYVSTKM